MIREQGITSRIALIIAAIAVLTGCKARTGPGAVALGIGGGGAAASSTQTQGQAGSGGQTTTTTTTGGSGGGGGGIGPSASLTGPPGTGNRALLMYNTNKADALIGSRSTNEGIAIDLAENIAANSASASFPVQSTPVGGIPLPGTNRLTGEIGNPASSTNRYLPAVATINTELLVSRNLGPAVAFGPDELLSDANYGLVLVDGTNPTTIYVGGFHTGNVTPVGQVPAGITATYNGRFLGRYLPIGRTTVAITQIVGDMALTANFGTGTVNGVVTNLDDAFGNATGYGLAMNGAINGAGYTGTARFTDLVGNNAGTVSSSALNGAFYGANAAETAGAILLQGGLPVGANPIVDSAGTSVALFGAFGAKR